jgi:amidohydrolase
MEFLQRAQGLRERLVAIRRDLHRHPELSFQEIRTAKKITEILAELHISFKTGIAKTGVVAEIGKGGPVIGLRADMDALPMIEATEVAHKSTTPGVMHACGHDAHVACLLGAAMLLAEDFKAGCLKGTVRLLFQPSEETPDTEGKSGAGRMVEEGVLAGLDGVFGLHVDPSFATGQVQLRTGPIMAASDYFEAAVIGQGGHAAAPHKALDPIWLAAQVVNSIHGIVSRRIDPAESGIISITTIHAGTATNIIPPEVTLSGTIRSFSQETRTRLHAELEKCFSLAKTMGGNYRLKITNGYPVTVNDARMVHLVRAAAGRVFEAREIGEMALKMGCEDFSFMAQTAPATFAFLGCRPSQGDRFHHSPVFDIDEQALSYGAALHCAVVHQFFSDSGQLL